MVATETEISLLVFRKEYRDLYMLEILQALSDIVYLMILHVKQAKKNVSKRNWKNGWHSEAPPLGEHVIQIEDLMLLNCGVGEDS